MDRFSVGVDPAAACGYAVLDARGKRVASGVWDLSVRPGEGAGMRYVRFVGYFRRLLTDLELNGDNAMVFYEAPIAFGHAGKRAPNDTGPAIVSHIQFQCEAKGIPYASVPLATAKKVASGGRASKAQMVDAANHHWNLRLPLRLVEGKEPTFPGGSDNEADALWIGEAGRRGIGE